MHCRDRWTTKASLEEIVAVDLWLLKAGHRIGLDDGSEAMVLNETLDGDWIRIRYLS